MKWDTWGNNLMDSNTDYSGYEGVRLLFELPKAANKDYLEEMQRKITAIRGRSLKVMLCIDYHVRDPYHGPPPQMTLPKDKWGDSCLGLAPFPWKRGWQWARSRIFDVADWYDPDFIQMTERPDVRKGWGFGPKPEAGFKDAMRIYQQGLIEDAGWSGGFVIPHTPIIPAMEREGMKKASRKWGSDHGVKMPAFSDVVKESSFNWVVAVPGDGPPDPEDKPTREEAKRLIGGIMDDLFALNDDLETLYDMMDDME